MQAFLAERAACKGEARQQVFPFEVGELLQQIFHRVTAREVFEHRLHGITQSADARLSVANFGIDRDACQQLVVRHGASIGLRAAQLNFR